MVQLLYLIDVKLFYIFIYFCFLVVPRLYNKYLYTLASTVSLKYVSSTITRLIICSADHAVVRYGI